jgi:Cu2+-exporting ATPase
MIAAGERIPVDGVVESGRSDVDRSIVNGESAPAVAAGPGTPPRGRRDPQPDRLASGRSRRDGRSEGFLPGGGHIGLMEAAEGGRARYRRIADRAAQLYAPGGAPVMALGAFLGWGVLRTATGSRPCMVSIAVLIITCPCALGACGAGGAGGGGRPGCLPERRHGEGRIGDGTPGRGGHGPCSTRTGTLTLGQPAPRRCGMAVKRGHPALSRLALAAHSRHPLSRGALPSAAPGPRPGLNEVRRSRGTAGAGTGGGHGRRACLSPRQPCRLRPVQWQR